MFQDGSAYKVLQSLAKKLPNGKQEQFGISFLKYIKDTWLFGKFPPETWNMYMHRGATTNNFNEGTNNMINNFSGLDNRPNRMDLSEFIKNAKKVKRINRGWLQTYLTDILIIRNFFGSFTIRYLGY